VIGRRVIHARLYRLAAAKLCLAAALMALAACAALVLAGPARTQSTSVDAVAQARLIVQGSASTGQVGSTIASVANLTGDGRPALVVGAPYKNLPGRRQAGVVYVVFDTPRTGTVSLDDPTLHGFRIIGGPYYRAGMDVAAAGDVNGDGRGDILLSAPRHGVTCPTAMSGPCGYRAPGVAFVIYSKADEGTVDLAHLRPSQGFEIKGTPGGAGSFAQTLAGLGDFAGDGFSAIAVAGAQDTASGLNYRGGAYVIYGGRHPGNVDLQHLGARGFGIFPETSGFSPTGEVFVAAVGDVTGDGRTALLLDSPGPTTGGVYVLFGRRYTQAVSLDDLGHNGFAIIGLNGVGSLGMAGVGDVNGDHRADLLLVRSPIGPGGAPPEADVVYGSASTHAVNLARLGSRGFRVLSAPIPAGYDLQLGPVAGLGDLNGDGRADLGITTETFPTTTGGAGPYQGTVNVVFGSHFASPVQLGDLGTAGYQLTTEVPPASCPPLTSSGSRLGASPTALGNFSATGQPEFAIGATGLGVPGVMQCSLPAGEVLIETIPSP